MKRVLLGFLIVVPVILLSFSMSVAQEPVGELESLQVSFWPDFDRPSVLVLVTGQLPEGSSLPAEISIPVPANAEVNAVAHIDEEGMASIDYDLDGDAVTFLTPNRQFRVEYYAPYEQDGRSRSYDFAWEADLSVAEFKADVQQPANASGLSSEPEALDVYTSQVDGLIYQAQDPVSVSAGTPYNLSFRYEMTSDGLTMGPSAAEAPDAVSQQVLNAEPENNWLLLVGVLGLIVLAMAGTWMIATRSSKRKSSRPRKPKPKPTTNTAKSKASVFCHVCGQPAESDDRFCRQCGTELKNR